MSMNHRRRVLQGMAAAGLITGLPACALPLFDGPLRLSRDPFRLGVAAGYPTPDGITLWTRLLLDDAAPEVLQRRAIAVRWEVSADDAFVAIVAAGNAQAAPSQAHSVHVDVRGLEPERWYRYRFSGAGAVSPAGRFRTAPAAQAQAAGLRFAVASCQQYEQGHYGAYRHIVRDSPDLVLFLGDYIYEGSWGRNHVRKHGAGEAYTLDAYRQRYALYKSDRDLQAAHAACAWLLTWDDHEVDNDYANDRPEDGMPAEAFLARRAAAYQAYYEHMPLPARMKPQGPALQLYSESPWGRLASFYMLDDRQYRSHQACARPGRGGGSNTIDVAACADLADPARTMLGLEQERWLGGVLGATRASWNLLGQQTLIAPSTDRRNQRSTVWTDGWDGYPAARRRLIAQLMSAPNPVTFGGDMHSFHVADLKRIPSDDASPVAASEFVTTSITSQPRSQNLLDALARANPHMKLAEGRYRGYIRVLLRPERLEADLRAMRDVATPDAECFTLASYEIESGRPGPVRR